MSPCGGGWQLGEVDLRDSVNVELCVELSDVVCVGGVGERLCLPSLMLSSWVIWCGDDSHVAVGWDDVDVVQSSQ